MAIPSKKPINKKLIFHYPANEALRKFKKFGFTIDVETDYFYILRDNNYPFHRVSIPKEGLMSNFTLKLILYDVGINYEHFMEM